MSTRATYKIDGHWFYIHYDGYHAGAAEYLANAVDNMAMVDPDSSFGRRMYAGGLAEAFLRSNPIAEFTTSGDDHGDTEHEYHVAGTDITVIDIGRSWDDDKIERVTVFNGPLAEFLNLHIYAETEEDRFVTARGELVRAREIVRRAENVIKRFSD
jgi:hypothetical protein